MREFDLGSRFTLATIPFRPFQHLMTVEDQLSCLASIRRHLVDDGVLILDLFNPSLDFLVNRPIGEELDEEAGVHHPGRQNGGAAAQDRCGRSLSAGRAVRLIYYVSHPDGRQERLVQAFPMRYLFRFEAEHLLARAGFTLEHVYADYDRSPYGTKYPGELLMVARKS
jgi:hypothetical protein